MSGSAVVNVTVGRERWFVGLGSETYHSASGCLTMRCIHEAGEGWICGGGAPEPGALLDEIEATDLRATGVGRGPPEAAKTTTCYTDSDAGTRGSGRRLPRRTLAARRACRREARLQCRGAVSEAFAWWPDHDWLQRWSSRLLRHKSVPWRPRDSLAAAPTTWPDQTASTGGNVSHLNSASTCDRGVAFPGRCC